MSRHYYLTRSGRLRRKDNTLHFELAGETEDEKLPENVIETADDSFAGDVLSDTGQNLGADGLGEFFLETEVGRFNQRYRRGERS